MLSVQGIYDGKKVYPIERINNIKRYKVIITFVEELDDSEQDNLTRAFGENSSAFSFW